MSLKKIFCSSSLCLLCACLGCLPAAAGASAPHDLPENRNHEQQCAMGDAAACLTMAQILLHADPAEPDLSLLLVHVS